MTIHKHARSQHMAHQAARWPEDGEIDPAFGHAAEQEARERRLEGSPTSARAKAAMHITLAAYGLRRAIEHPELLDMWKLNARRHTAKARAYRLRATYRTTEARPTSIYERAQAQHEAHRTAPVTARHSYTIDQHALHHRRHKQINTVTDTDRALAAHWLADAIAATQTLADMHRANGRHDLRDDLIDGTADSLRAAEHYRLGYM